ncbi:hypothetical protein DPMN_138097 [Dreissena polymorpha]|uniref:Uncharacterized protein n=1 Tax=Dreissena polymorpha TaxID=45954 RepID=A0A9D4JEB1_DREPO|nr:hypothetical protein DPMN_138097 [Dreissena polymorpha]
MGQFVLKQRWWYCQGHIDPANNLCGTHMGPMWAPIWAPCGQPTWDPDGECSWAPYIWVPFGLPHVCLWGSPDGTHLEHGCTPHLGPMSATHMGPI